MVAQTTYMSHSEFLALPNDGDLHEFVRGEVRRMPPPKGRHGLFEAAIIGVIDRYLDDRARQLGWMPEQGLEARSRLVGFVAGGEFGMQFTLPDDPHQVRGADAVYVSAEQYARVSWSDRTYFPEVPPLVIEVISPSESAMDVNEKVQDYLAGGARRVWYVYPERQTVHIHDAAAPTRVLHRSESLVDDELLPGFALPLGYLFPAVSTEAQ